ncbi:MAG: hypothetical protein ACE5E9_11085 [Nitrospinaceae bacterium]
MKEEERVKLFLHKARKTLDSGTEGMDAQTLSRLASIRRRALQSEESLPLWEKFRRGFPVPLTAVTAASVLLVAALMFFFRGDPGPLNQFQDLEILASGDNLEFYEELDFFAWLAEEEPNAG